MLISLGPQAGGVTADLSWENVDADRRMATRIALTALPRTVFLHPPRIAVVNVFLVLLVMAMMFSVIAVVVSIVIPYHGKRKPVEKQRHAEKHYQTEFAHMPSS